MTALTLGLSASLAQNTTPAALGGLTKYTFGTPSGDEVEMLELINRARANPPAEGQRLVAALQALYPNGGSGFNYNQLTAQFNGYPTRPPLAFNADLNAAAQAHLKDDLSLGYSQHNSPDGTSAQVRMQQFGYTTPTNENVDGQTGYNVVERPWVDHSTYELNDLGHRDAILEFDVLGSVEVGVAFQSAGGWNVEDFGGNGTSPLLTGAVFTDDANTGFYVSGEGEGGVVVTSNLSSYYAVTVNGAYSLPLDLAPEYDAGKPAPVTTVTFTNAGGTAGYSEQVTLGHTLDGYGGTYHDAASHVRYDNAKADWMEAAAGGATPTPMPTPTPTPTPASPPSVTITPAPSGMGFIVTRTGDTSGTLLVSYVVKGTAVAGQDYLPLKGTKKLKAGKAQANLSVTLLPGAAGSIKLVLTKADAYTVGSPGQGKLRLSGTP